MNVYDLLHSFAAKKILVIGDTIVDVNSYCDAIGISAETPTMVIRKKLADERRGHYDEISLGGAALVVRNLLELGAQVDFLTYAGDGEGHLHLENFTAPGLKVHTVYAQAKCGKPVTIKHRFWAGGYKLLQVDTRNDKPIDGLTEYQAVMQYNILMGVFDKTHDAVVIADYRHGFITPVMARTFSKNTTNTTVYVSSQVSQSDGNHKWYGEDGSWPTFVVNERERSFIPCGADFICTCGPSGAKVGEVDFPAIMVDAVDTCGAGDAFLAACVLSQSIKFANIWAGLSCLTKGANPPTKADLIDWYEKNGQVATGA